MTVSTNLGGWVNRRGLFAKEDMADMFKRERIPSTYTWDFSPKGQHMELGIAEMNLFIMLSALGLSHAINGERLIPVGTLYDPFIYRGADALNYACYQNARFLLVATPSGISLAGEGGAHQSIGTPLVGMAQDGLASFEPAFVDELAVIMALGVRLSAARGRGGAGRGGLDPRQLRRLGLSPALHQADRAARAHHRRRTARGHRRRCLLDAPPGPNCEIVVAYTGAMAPEAMEAVGLMAESRRDIGLLAITSADRLNAGWTASSRARENGEHDAQSHVERLLADVPQGAALITVIDGHPATLAWLGSVYGHRTRSLGVEHFGQTGTLKDLYRHYGIDAHAILKAANAVAAGRPISYVGSVRAG